MIIARRIRSIYGDYIPRNLNNLIMKYFNIYKVVNDKS